MSRSLALAFVALAACTAAEDSGLTITETAANRSAGTFERDGVALAFDFARDGERHVLAFRTPDGEALHVTTLEGTHQTTELFGSRLVVSGTVDLPDPEVRGDREALAELLARPEAALLEPLRDALVASDIDPDLYDPKPATHAGVVTDYDGRYFQFAPGDERWWIAAGGASPTYIYVQNPWPKWGACASVLASPAWPHTMVNIVVNPWGANHRTVYWWGSTMLLVNPSWAQRQPDGRTCQPTSVLVRVSPYWWSP